MNSRAYIAAFEKLDRNPAEDPELRDKQVIALARKLLKSDVDNVADPQVLALHNSYMRGWF